MYGMKTSAVWGVGQSAAFFQAATERVLGALTAPWYLTITGAPAGTTWRLFPGAVFGGGRHVEALCKALVRVGGRPCEGLVRRPILAARNAVGQAVRALAAEFRADRFLSVDKMFSLS